MSYKAKKYRLEKRKYVNDVCELCGKVANKKVMINSVANTYWWAATVCSEGCFNMWVLRNEL